MAWQKIAHATAAGLALLLLAACSDDRSFLEGLFTRSEAVSSEDAADVYVSAYPPVPWASISAKLAPNNNLSIDQARSMAAQTTQIQVEQALSTFAAGLALGLPGTSATRTTTIAANGTTQTTGSRTTSTGTVPSSSGTPSASLPASAPTPSLSSGPMATGIDASTWLIAGTALYQQAAILDNQITNELLPEDYQAYLITLQINLQPKRRDLPYDAYTDVSLLPADWSQAWHASDEVHGKASGLPPIKVYPLIIMDAEETTNIGRSLQAIRQASLQLSGIVSGVGVAAGASGAIDRAASVVGLDKNSLVTVGRISDNTVRIRLGAENSGSSGLAMVPRSYNVSLVVLTRWNPTPNSKDRVTSLSVVTHTSIVDAVGKPARKREPQLRVELAHQVCRAVRNFFGDSATRSTIGETCGQLRRAHGKEPYVTTALNFLRAADRGDYVMVGKCLGIDDSLNVQGQLTLWRFLSELAEIQADSRFSSFVVSLQGSKEATLPDQSQLALMSDDGSQTATVVLRGGSGLDAKQIHAALMLTDGTTLLPTSLSIVGDGSEIDIAFPSIKKLGVKLPAKPLWFATNRSRSGAATDEKTSARYVIKQFTATTARTTNPVHATQTTLTPDAATRSATVTLFVAKSSSAQLTISGADIRSVSGAATQSVTGISLQPNGGLVVLSLGNLTPARPVIATTVSADNKPIGDPIMFTVELASTK